MSVFSDEDLLRKKSGELIKRLAIEHSSGENGELRERWIIDMDDDLIFWFTDWLIHKNNGQGYLSVNTAKESPFDKIEYLELMLEYAKEIRD